MRNEGELIQGKCGDVGCPYCYGLSGDAVQELVHEARSLRRAAEHWKSIERSHASAEQALRSRLADAHELRALMVRVLDEDYGAGWWTDEANWAAVPHYKRELFRALTASLRAVPPRFGTLTP